jgi:hypothetical protein
MEINGTTPGSYIYGPEQQAFDGSWKPGGFGDVKSTL